MREKSNFGKKPVRRSKSEEKETPKTYMPRTAKSTGAKSKKSENLIENSEDSGSAKSYRSREDREETRRPARRTSDSTGSSTRRAPKESKGTTYKPRTMKRFSSDKEDSSKADFIEKPERDDRPKRQERSDWTEKPRRSERPERSERSEKKDRFSKSDRPERSERRERSEYPKKSDRPERSGRSDRNDRYGKDRDAGRGNRDRKPYSDGKPSKYSRDSVKKVIKTSERPPHIEANLKTDNDGLIRLNKYIANSGLCSRREADEYITKGQITVNGIEITELGTKVKLTDEVRFKEKALDPEKKVYILLNKPKDYVTTVEDPNATHTVMELIEGACTQRVYPVGRLDRNSTGLLLFTNDGELTKQLTHPSFLKKKIYEVGLDKNVRPEDIEAIRNGIDLEGEIIAADEIEYVDPQDKSVIGIEIHSGQNRVVRRIFEKLGYRVYKLDRVYFAGLTKKNLPRGKWRFLSQKEVEMLKMNRFR